MNPDNPNFRTIEGWEKHCELLVKENSDLKAELKILKNPSDYRCMEIQGMRKRIAALKAEVERLKSEYMAIFNENDFLRAALSPSRHGEHCQFKDQLTRERECNKVLKEALTGGGYNSVRETIALMAEGEGTNHKIYIQMAAHALKKLDAALANEKEMRK